MKGYVISKVCSKVIKTCLGISKDVETLRYLSLVVPLTKVGDEAVHKELGRRMERAATTASSLEAECQDTILGDVNAQTRFEITSKQSIDPPLSRGYTLRSKEDNMKLIGIDEILYTTVLDLQKAKDAQAKEMRAIQKGTRVESSEDQESLGAPEDASKQGRSIVDIDADVDVSLVDETQKRQNDDLMFAYGVLEDDVMHVEAKVDGKDEQIYYCSIDDSAVPYNIEERKQRKRREEGREETTKGSRKKMLGRKRARKEQQKESSKKQKDEDIAIDAIPLTTKLPVIVNYKLLKDGMMLQGIDREDLEALWRIVKAKYGDTRPENEFERVLYGDLKVIV
ncbi:hypothetical protein Tco_0853188 [Tanacetum coccineum]